MKRYRTLAGLICFFAFTSSCALAATPKTTTAPEVEAASKAADRGINFLLDKGQTPEGAFSPEAGPAVTALAVVGILKNGRSVDDPGVAKSLKYLEGFVAPDGSISKKESYYKNYETCLGLIAFVAANRDGRYAKQIKAAESFIKKNQWDEDEGIDAGQPEYGGAGYGSHKRPDLSNTQFLLEALKEAGAGPEDEAMRKALIFVSRCQNLESEYNTTAAASKNPDGGFYYTAASGGVSQSGNTDGGGLRSYGSMTYAGLKSMIYAGLKPDDVRVKAATKWIAANYDLKSNPGMKPGTTGQYYYYVTFAKALAATGQKEIFDAKNVKHNWRKDLITELVDRQRSDGSWANSDSRWMESDPNLVTSYVLIALASCKE